jgi:hypothetical protein
MSSSSTSARVGEVAGDAAAHDAGSEHGDFLDVRLVIGECSLTATTRRRNECATLSEMPSWRSRRVVASLRFISEKLFVFEYPIQFRHHLPEVVQLRRGEAALHRLVEFDHGVAAHVAHLFAFRG